jgi:hypothetical protein
LIEIRVNGCHQDKELGRILKGSAWFFIKKLMPRKRRLKVIVQSIKGLLEKEGIHGDCLADDFSVNGMHYEFIVRLDHTPDDRQLMIATLAHEISHVRQYSIGQLRYDYSHSNISIWEGKRYDSNEMAYDDLPWEIDATQNEKALMSIYK